MSDMASLGHNIYVPLIQSSPFIYPRLPNVWKASYTISASIFVDVPYWRPIAWVSSSLVLYRVPRQWFFHFGEEIVIARTQIGRARWMFQNLPLSAAQEVRDSSSGITPCIVLKNVGVLYHHVLHGVPKNILCTTTSCHFNFDPGTLLEFCKHCLMACTIPMKVNVLHTAVDWQSTVTAGCTSSSNSPCSCPQSWQLSNWPSSSDSSVVITFYLTFISEICKIK